MIVIRPVATHQYFINKNKSWDDVVEDVIDVFVRTKHYTEGEFEDWEILIYTQEISTRIKSDSHILCDCSTNEQKLYKCLDIVMGALGDHWEHAKQKRLIHKEEFLIEVKYIQQDFISELDCYEKLVKHCEDLDARCPGGNPRAHGKILAQEHREFVELIQNSMPEWKKCATL